MTQGSNSEQLAQPSMLRAGLSALVLFAGLFLLAKLVIVAPARSDDGVRSAAPRTARTHEKRPSAGPRQFLIRPLTTSRMASQLRVRPLGARTKRHTIQCQPVVERRSKRIPSSAKDGPGAKKAFLRLLHADQDGHEDESADEEYACGAVQTAHQVELFDLAIEEESESPRILPKIRAAAKLKQSAKQKASPPSTARSKARRRTTVSGKSQEQSPSPSSQSSGSGKKNSTTKNSTTRKKNSASGRQYSSAKNSHKKQGARNANPPIRLAPPPKSKPTGEDQARKKAEQAVRAGRTLAPRLRAKHRKDATAANKPETSGPSGKSRIDLEPIEKVVRRPEFTGLDPLSKPDVPEKKQRERLLMESDGWKLDNDEQHPSMEARCDRIRRCLDFYYDRPLHNLEDSPWSMMHHMIAWGVDSRILIKQPTGKVKDVSTIGWLCGNGICDGDRLLFVEEGKLQARTGPGLQGHDGQFLAMLAQARVSRGQTILVDGDKYNVDDLIRQEQLSCRPRSELTFKLIGMAHYLPVDASWESANGQKWTIERLVEEELRQPINGTTCGGTHRLMGFTYAVERRCLVGKKIDGVWARAEAVTRRHRDIAFRWQHRDGSFSSDFFRSSGNWGDINRKLKTTGHVLEWLVFAAPPEQLDDPRIVRAVDYLCHLLTTNRYYDWENGPLGHGIRALSLYDERAFNRRPGKRDLQMAAERPRLVPRTSEASNKSQRRSSPQLRFSRRR